MQGGDVMQRLLWMLLLVVALPRGAAAQDRDTIFWIPPSAGRGAAEANVQRDKAYYAIKLHSIFANYESGFLDDISRLVIASQTLSAEPNLIAQSAIIHKNWQRLDRRGDFVAVNDYLVALSPATASEIQIKIQLRGVGEESFAPVFNSLADPALKSALSLSPSTSGSVAALTLAVEKFLAPPYYRDRSEAAVGHYPPSRSVSSFTSCASSLM